MHITSVMFASVDLQLELIMMRWCLIFFSSNIKLTFMDTSKTSGSTITSIV